MPAGLRIAIPCARILLDGDDNAKKLGILG